MSLRTIEYATNTYEKYFYTFRINQVTFTHGERKKERPNFYGKFSQNLPNSAAFSAILKLELPQCNVIGVRTPPACAPNLLRSLFGYFALKSFQAFVSSAILFATSDLSHASPKGRELEELDIFITFVIKIVVRIIISDSNDYTVCFREPLGKSNYIRFLSCPLCNS